MLLARVVPFVLVAAGLVLQDAAPDLVVGKRWCLAPELASTSPQLTETLCFTPGTADPPTSISWPPGVAAR